MEYNLSVNDREKTIRIETDKENSFSTELDAAKLHVNYKRIDDYTLRLEIDNGKTKKGVSVHLVDSEGGKTIFINGVTYAVKNRDNLPVGTIRKQVSTNLPDKITPPMPATVISVLVNKNDLVQKGDGIVVISAMKMETTLTAPFNGRVISLNTSRGEKVMPGDILVDIEEEE